MTAGVGTDDFNGGSAFGAGVLGKDNAKKAPLNILLDNKTIIKKPAERRGTNTSRVHVGIIIIAVMLEVTKHFVHVNGAKNAKFFP